MFETQLVVREVDGDVWELAEALVYSGAEERFELPVGFRTDFASVPRPLWPLIPRTGRYTKAAVVHDWLYSVQVTTREDADGLFRRIMGELGVGRARRWLMWRAVRIGGRGPWARAKRKRGATSPSP